MEQWRRRGSKWWPLRKSSSHIQISTKSRMMWRVGCIPEWSNSHLKNIFIYGLVTAIFLNELVFSWQFASLILFGFLFGFMMQLDPSGPCSSSPDSRKTQPGQFWICLHQLEHIGDIFRQFWKYCDLGIGKFWETPVVQPRFHTHFWSQNWPSHRNVWQRSCLSRWRYHFSDP